MTTKRKSYWIIVLASLISVAIWLLNWQLRKPQERQRYESRVFEGFCGWGYDILVDNQVLIHQESVPVLTGNCGFARQEWAKLAAELIINNLKNGRDPQLTSFDLQTIADPQIIVHAPVEKRP